MFLFHHGERLLGRGKKRDIFGVLTMFTDEERKYMTKKEKKKIRRKEKEKAYATTVTEDIAVSGGGKERKGRKEGRKGEDRSHIRSNLSLPLSRVLLAAQKDKLMLIIEKKRAKNLRFQKNE